MQVVVVALEHRVRLEVHLDVEVPRRPAVDAGFAFAGQAHAVAFVDAGRNLHCQRLLRLDAAGAVAGDTGVRDGFAAAMAARAGLRDGKRALRNAHLAGAAAGGAGLRLCAGLGAGAAAGDAFGERRDADLGLEAVRRLLEVDLEVVAQVRAAEHGGTAAARAAENLAENVAEDVAEAGAASRTSGGGRVDPRMAVLVVGRALLRVGEDLVGFFRLLEV